MLTLVIDGMSVLAFVVFLFGYVMKVVTRSMLPDQAETADETNQTSEE